jgi:hypothetical protein
MIARIAVGDGNDRRLRLLFPTVALACAYCLLTENDVVSTCTRLRFHAKDLSCLSDNASKQPGGIVRVQPIQSAPQAVDTLASRP